MRFRQLLASVAVAGSMLLLPQLVAAGDPGLSGTATALCQGPDDPVIEASNTGTGPLTFAVAGTGFPLPAGQTITVQWPTDNSGPLPQVDWEMLIPGTQTVVESGTLLLPDCPVTTEPPTADPPGATPTSPPSQSGTNLPETGASSGWIAAAATGFVLVGSALLTLRRRPN